MNLYLVSYWVPFPSSEYGGVYAVVAENDTQCINLLMEENHEQEYNHLIANAVNEAQVFELVGDQQPRIVYDFTT